MIILQAILNLLQKQQDVEIDKREENFLFRKNR